MKFKQKFSFLIVLTLLCIISQQCGSEITEEDSSGYCNSCDECQARECGTDNYCCGEPDLSGSSECLYNGYVASGNLYGSCTDNCDCDGYKVCYLGSCYGTTYLYNLDQCPDYYNEHLDDSSTGNFLLIFFGVFFGVAILMCTIYICICRKVYSKYRSKQKQKLQLQQEQNEQFNQLQMQNLQMQQQQQQMNTNQPQNGQFIQTDQNQNYQQQMYPNNPQFQQQYPYPMQQQYQQTQENLNNNQAQNYGQFYQQYPQNYNQQPYQQGYYQQQPGFYQQPYNNQQFVQGVPQQYDQVAQDSHNDVKKI